MIYDKNVSFEKLESEDEKLKSNGEEIVYPLGLIQQLKEGKSYVLREIDVSYRKNKTFMEPLLYAFKNKFKTYEVYKFYTEDLQEKDSTIAMEIAEVEPQIFKDTAISRNEKMMIALAKINPKVVPYISNNLLNSGKFIENLEKECGENAVKYAINECNVTELLQDNPVLVSNPVFMKEAIKEDASILSKLDDNFKDDYEFIREISQANPEVINYITEHTEEFGKKAIIATKEVLTEKTSCRAIDEFQTELEEVQKEKARMESQEGFDKESEEYKELLLMERHAQVGIRFVERIRNSEDPRRALDLVDKLCKIKGEDYRQDLIKYFKLDEAVIAKKKEEIAKMENQKNNNRIVTPEQIENVTAGKEIRTSEINEGTRDIREEYENERQTELGGENDRGTDEERI